MQKLKPFLDNLRVQAEANPILALGVGAAVATSLSKLLDANTSRVSAKTHAKEVDRRVRKSAAY